MTYNVKYLMMISAGALVLMTGAAQAHDNDRNDNAIRNGDCREYSQDVWINGRQTTAYGTACLQRGDWIIKTSSIGKSRYHHAGPIVILPQHNSHAHYHEPQVIYRTAPTVIYKSNKPTGYNWGYQEPVKKKVKQKKYYNQGNKRNNNNDVQVILNW